MGVGGFYCLLMGAFDVEPQFAVCTPGPLSLHPDWLSAGEGDVGEQGREGGGATKYIPGNTFQSAGGVDWGGKAVKELHPHTPPALCLRCKQLLHHLPLSIEPSVLCSHT